MQQASTPHVARMLHRIAKFRWPAFVAAVTLVSCIVGLRSKSPPALRPDPSNTPGRQTVSIDVNLSSGHPVSEKLFGIFFEDINHAGEGGLYAEMVQDRSFDALALTQRFKPSAAPGAAPREIPTSAFIKPSYGRPIDSIGRPQLSESWNVSNMPSDGLGDVPVAWSPIGAALGCH
jgi:hypothetical protein